MLSGRYQRVFSAGKLLVERARTGSRRDLYLGDGRERRTRGRQALWFSLRRLAPRHGLVAQLPGIAAEYPREHFAVSVAEHPWQAALEELVHIGAVASHHDRGVRHGKVALAQQVPDPLPYRIVRPFTFVCRHILVYPIRSHCQWLPTALVCIATGYPLTSLPAMTHILATHVARAPPGPYFPAPAKPLREKLPPVDHLNSVTVFRQNRIISLARNTKRLLWDKPYGNRR